VPFPLRQPISRVTCITIDGAREQLVDVTAKRSGNDRSVLRSMPRGDHREQGPQAPPKARRCLRQRQALFEQNQTQRVDRDLG
jgi:hypothetical protein